MTESGKERNMLTKDILLEVMKFYAEWKDLERDPVLHMNSLIDKIINSRGCEIPLVNFRRWLEEIANDPNSKFVIDKREHDDMGFPTRFYLKGYEPLELKKQVRSNDPNY